MGKPDSGIKESKGKGEKRIMPEEQITIGINELAELIRNKYGYKSVSIDRIWTGIRCNDMQYVELGPGSILDVHISVSGKTTEETIIIITRPSIGLSIEIANPQPAFTKNNIAYMSDADYAKEVLAEGDDEMMYQLRGNMKLVSETLKEEKPLCTDICPDPDAVRVVDNHSAIMKEETKAAIARNWARIANCHLKKEYKCKWDKQNGKQ